MSSDQTIFSCSPLVSSCCCFLCTTVPVSSCVSLSDSLQKVLVSASSSEASVSQSGRALVPVSSVAVPVLPVSVEENVSVTAASSAPACTSASVQVPRLHDSSVPVQASGIASSKSLSSSVNVPVCTAPEFCISVVPASGDKSVCSSGVDYVSLHERVRASGFPNYVSCRLSVPSRLNIPLWRQYLHDYHDARICDFLEYGWPVGYDYSTQGFPVSQLRNHQGALLFPDAIDSYLQNEICRNAVLGPFETNPFSCSVALSPLNSVPKHDSAERRIIVDLSWPAGTSVNDGISSSSYLGEDISLTYPTVDSIASLIWSVGTGCLLYKRDLKRAYRQFPVDPLDYPLLGYCWKHSLYFDLVLPMGLRSAAMACQRITNAVCYICELEGHHTLSYLDDFIGVATPDIAWQAYDYCGHLLAELGLEESLSKACPPATIQTCLGVQFDTVQMTLSVTPTRLTEIETLLVSWSTKKSATKSALQSLVGKLSFISKCVRQSRLFLSRILALLRTLKQNGHCTRLTAEFRRDIAWWLRFMRTYNGVSMISSLVWTAPDAVFSTDACLSGCGGLTQSQYFHVEFPVDVLARFSEIHLLEALAILVALRLWGHLWAGCRIQVLCDNAAVVSALTSGKVKDQSLAAISREIWYLAASQDFELRAVHLPGEENRAADFLSRWHIDSSLEARFKLLPVFSRLSPVPVPPEFFEIYDY